MEVFIGKSLINGRISMMFDNRRMDEVELLRFMYLDGFCHGIYWASMGT